MKILAFDLDGTVINDSHQIVDKNIKAVELGRNLGFKMVPCTGRSPTFVKGIADELGISFKDEYLILCNGALIVDALTNDVIMCCEIDYETVCKLFDYGIDSGFDVQLSTINNVYAFNKEMEISERAKVYGERIEFLQNNDIEFLRNEKIIKVVYERTQLLNNHKKIEMNVKQITNNCVEVIISYEGIIEIAARNTSKASGLTFLANYLNIPIEDTIAVGDSVNDIEIVEIAGLGIAVKNALSSVKEVADVVADRTNNEGVLEEIVNKYLISSYL